MYLQRLKVRFDDVDYARIVYFPRLFGYCHWAFEDFFPQELGVSYAELLTVSRVGFPTVHSEAEFKSPLRFGEICRVEMEVLKLGHASLLNGYRLYRGESQELCAEIQLTHVATNLDAFKAVPIPPNVRAAFSQHLRQSAGT